MDISLNKIQKNIVKEARRFLDKECPFDFTREMADDERGFRDDIWSKMTEMDWMAIRIPEPYGGVGMEQMDLSIILEEMGRVLLPGPFFATVMLAAETIMAAGSESQKEHYLSKISNGEMRGTLALYEQDGGADPSHIQMEARTDGDEFILNGTKLFVTDAHVADFLIVAARTGGGNDPVHGITLFLVSSDVDGLSISSLPTMDGTRKLCVVDFQEVPVSRDGILGEPHHGWDPLGRALQRAQVGLCAESVGGAQRAMEMAVEHAKTRIQFDRPLGAFQAIKHRCAQMYLEVESARAILYWAAWAQDHGDPQEAALAASAAKSYCTESFTKVTNSALQVLGATGFSWENDIHLYLKRAKANEMALGDPTYHRERIMQLLAS